MEEKNRSPILIKILKYCHLETEKCLPGNLSKRVNSYEETLIAYVQNFIIIDLVFA